MDEMTLCERCNRYGQFCYCGTPNYPEGWERPTATISMRAVAAVAVMDAPDPTESIQVRINKFLNQEAAPMTPEQQTEVVVLLHETLQLLRSYDPLYYRYLCTAGHHSGHVIKMTACPVPVRRDGVEGPCGAHLSRYEGTHAVEDLQEDQERLEALIREAYLPCQKNEPGYGGPEEQGFKRCGTCPNCGLAGVKGTL